MESAKRDQLPLIPYPINMTYSEVHAYKCTIIEKSCWVIFHSRKLAMTFVTRQRQQNFSSKQFIFN